MTHAIYKYPLQTTGAQIFEMPLGARLLTVQVQHDQACLWALVDPDAGYGKRRIRTYGTGHPIETPPEKLKHVGTYQLHGGALVFHVFEES